MTTSQWPKRTTRYRRNPPRQRIASPHHASVMEVEHLALLLISIRPEWDESLVRVVLLSHCDQCDASDLAIAAIRAARDPEVREPRWLGHRGRWWDHAITTPAYVAPKVRCQVCGRLEPDCYSIRFGDDDHTFEPPEVLL